MTRAAPRGVWLIAGTPGDWTYPCMCLGDAPCRRWCFCRGRVDVDKLPALCCARRAVETKGRQE